MDPCTICPLTEFLRNQDPARNYSTSKVSEDPVRNRPLVRFLRIPCAICPLTYFLRIPA